MTPYSLVSRYQHFGRTYCFHIPWRGRQCISSKYWCQSTRLHGLI